MNNHKVKQQIFDAVNLNNWDKYGNIINFLACTKYDKTESFEKGCTILWFYQPSTKFVIDNSYYIVSVSDDLDIEYDASRLMFYFNFKSKKDNIKISEKIILTKEMFLNGDINQLIYSIYNEVNSKLEDTKKYMTPNLKEYY